LFSITTFLCVSFGTSYCWKYCWRRMRVCSLLSINTAMAIAKYMQIRKIQNAFGIFQKSVDSLVTGSFKPSGLFPPALQK
ncbi:hypothetical protein F3Z05_24060, partial [Salmonella enterica]|nr:hypothetical protein [Salmonella enterica]